MTQRRVDFDALHKARAEANGECPVVVIGGVEYTLPASPPAQVLVGIGHLQNGNIGGLEEALLPLFGDGLPAVLAAGFDLEDFGPIFQECYGFDVGELPASGGSSSSTSTPSRPTSNGTTRPRSPQRSGAPTESASADSPS